MTKKRTLQADIRAVVRLYSPSTTILMDCLVVNILEFAGLLKIGKTFLVYEIYFPKPFKKKKKKQT